MKQLIKYDTVILVTDLKNAITGSKVRLIVNALEHIAIFRKIILAYHPAITFMTPV